MHYFPVGHVLAPFGLGVDVQLVRCEMVRGDWLEEGRALSKKASLYKTLRSTSPFRRQLFSLLEESEGGEGRHQG